MVGEDAATQEPRASAQALVAPYRLAGRAWSPPRTWTSAGRAETACRLLARTSRRTPQSIAARATVYAPTTLAGQSRSHPASGSGTAAR